jgi:hypothetical protein
VQLQFSGRNLHLEEGQRNSSVGSPTTPLLLHLEMLPMVSQAPTMILLLLTLTFTTAFFQAVQAPNGLLDTLKSLPLLPGWWDAPYLFSITTFEP